VQVGAEAGATRLSASATAEAALVAPASAYLRVIRTISGADAGLICGGYKPDQFSIIG
jgi:hypothetical protein